jgi:hypothetical protein
MSRIPNVPSVKDRVKGDSCIIDGETRIWNGFEWGCIHMKRKSRCVECKGFNICEHNIIKYACKKCGGKGVCLHGRQKARCKECNGGAICEHDRIRYECIDCFGGGICIHMKERSKCVECGGISICIHKKKINLCKECRGTSICIHNKNKHLCKECKGKSICLHDRIIYHCYICYINKHPEYFCTNCKYVSVIGISSPYKPYCSRCFYYLNPDKIPIRRYMMKENYIDQFLKTQFPTINMVHNKTTG